MVGAAGTGPGGQVSPGGPGRTAARLPPLDGVTVETPEHIAFCFEIAGIGSRGLALMIDALIVFALLAFLGGAFVMLLRHSLEAGSRAWAIAALVIAVYAVIWGYFAWFETRWHGQTPGKRLLGLRVVQDSGVGIGFLEAALRNVLRVVDFLPAFFSIGLVLMFLSRRAKRLGDLAAGTMVVKERRWVLRGFGPRDETVRRRTRGPVERRAESAGLTAEDYELLSAYLDRRKAFPQDVRLRLARTLTAPHLRDAGMPEEEIAALTLDDFESWVKARFSALEPTGRDTGAARNLHDFVRRKRPSWDRLSVLLDQVQGALWNRTSHADLRELGALYRKATADYAYAGLRFPRTDTLLFLNQLVARGHNAVYRRKPVTLAGVADFFSTRFPAAFRACAPQVGLAAAIFFAAALFGFLAVSVNEDVGSLFLSREAIDEHLRAGRLWTDDMVTVMPSSIASARILTNNVTVALLSFAFGIAFGIGTVWLLFLNGMMLGVVAGMCLRHGLAGSLAAFIAAHGPLELSGIFLAAGAGLSLAGAIVAPGNLRRGDALRRRARPAMTLGLGAVPILFLAGWIEGFISAAPQLPTAAKAMVGVVTGVALASWLACSGRGRTV